MFKQKKFQYEILQNLEAKLQEDIKSSEDDISRYEEKLSTMDKDEELWNWNCTTEYLDDAKSRKKAAEDILKQLEKIYG